MTIRLDSHLPQFHRGAPPQLPVRCATTANITIATALNNGDTLDGLTLATGDRVLVKDQTAGSGNGVYIVGVTPARSFDMAEGVAAWGAIIYVIAGTANGGTLWRNTNATLPTIDTTALTWAQITTDTSAFVTKTNGGAETIKLHGNLGSTATFDPADGNIHSGTLTTNCTVTLAAPTGSAQESLEGWFVQDATGGWTLGFAAAGGTFAWDGGVTPTLPTAIAARFRVVFERVPGTTNDIIGNLVGASSQSPLTTKGDLYGYSTIGARVPVGADGQVLTADSVQTLGLKWADPPPTDHLHISNITYSGDGATAAFELPAAPFDAYSVGAYVAGVRLDVALSGTLLTTMTFASPPASGTDNIVVDLVAAVA